MAELIASQVSASFLAASAVGCVVLGLWLYVFDLDRLADRRLRQFVQTPIGEFDEDAAAAQRRATRSLPKGRSTSASGRLIERLLSDARSSLSPRDVVLIAVVLVIVVGGLALLITREMPVALIAAVLGGAAPLGWLRWRGGRVVGRFTRQLPDTVGLLASSVRAGHSFLQALEQVADDAPEPTKEALLLVVREIGIGASQEDALERLLVRYPSGDLELVIASINVQHQIGGSLARILESIAETIRERLRIEGDIKALTAPQRVSAYVLSGLPVFLTLGLLFISNDYISPLFEPGPLRIALFTAIALVVSGFLVMRSMSKIDV